MQSLYPAGRYPLVKVALAWILGTILSHIFSLELPSFNGIILGLSMVALGLLIRYPSYRFVASIILYFLLISAGAVRYSQYHQNLRQQLPKFIAGRTIAWARISQTGRPNKWGQKAEAVIQSLSGQKCSIPVLIKLTQDTVKVRPGERILIQGWLKPLPDTGRYNAWLSLNGIHFSLSGKAFKKLPPGNSIQDWADEVGYYSNSELSKYVPDSSAAGLCMALLTGERSGMDKEMSARHRRLGTTHILSVSGLHVNLICWVLMSLIGWMGRWGDSVKRLRWAGISFVLIFYALMTGLAPSVCRAVAMTLLISGAGLLRRETNAMNLLCGTCFLQLWAVPTWLFHPGFQLSYMALAGLILLQPTLKQFWEPPAASLEYLWDTITATLAAQWFTLPFLLPLGADFPMYFIPANLLIVPLASLLTGLAFVLVCLSWFSFLGIWIGKLIYYLFYLLDLISVGLDKLPGVSVPIPFREGWGPGFWAVGLYGLAYLLIRYGNPKQRR